MKSSEKERILTFKAYKGLSQGKFEQAVGLSNGYLNNLKASPSSGILQKIFDAYPELSRVWLLTGEGEMLSSVPSVVATVGEGGNLQNGNGNSYGGECGAALERFVSELSAQREAYVRQIERVQSQNERLMSLLEAALAGVGKNV